MDAVGVTETAEEDSLDILFVCDCCDVAKTLCASVGNDDNAVQAMAVTLSHRMVSGCKYY